MWVLQMSAKYRFISGIIGKMYKKKQSRTIYRSTKRLTPLSLVKGTSVNFFITFPSYLKNYKGRFQKGSSYTTVFYSILQYCNSFIHIVADYSNTSGFWPRVRARALRAPVFLGSFNMPKGALRAPRPSQLRCFIYIGQKYKFTISRN